MREVSKSFSQHELLRKTSPRKKSKPRLSFSPLFVHSSLSTPFYTHIFVTDCDHTHTPSLSLHSPLTALSSYVANILLRALVLLDEISMTEMCPLFFFFFA